MYKTMRECFYSIFKYAPRKAMQYTGYSIVAAVLFPINVLLIERCIDSMETGAFQAFMLAFLFLMICSLAAVYIEHCRRVVDTELSQEFTRAYMPKVIQKLTQMRYSYFDDEKAADTLSRINGDPANSLVGLFKKGIDCIALLIRIYGVAFIYFKLSIMLGSVLFLILGIQIYVGILSQKEVVKLYETETQDERKLHYLGNLLCGKDSIFDLKVNQTVPYIQNLQKKRANQILKNRVSISLKAEKYYVLNLILMLGWTIILIIFLITNISNGSIALGLFATLLGSCMSLIGNQNTLSFYLSSMNGELLTYRALSGLWDYEEEEGNQELSGSDFYCIEFCHVSYKYQGMDKWALNDISFQICSNQTFALVGENGSGKSTIIKLLCGIYQPTKGEILANGKPLHQLSPESRRRLLSAIFQDFENYSMTAGENVGLGNIQYIDNREKIQNAIKCAGAEAIVEELPKGLLTNLNHLEEDGVALSGGQWQRLAIARAYMAESAFFLLDEPTASMDPIAESRMYQNFAEILKGKGVVLVSHRLASAVMADIILVLDKGELVQRGSHEELMKEEGIYKKMFEYQAGWYKTGQGEVYEE